MKNPVNMLQTRADSVFFALDAAIAMGIPKSRHLQYLGE